ncbi:winged helix-turn-helix domain-containing protein [Streptomyces albidoflavus]
MTSATPVTGGPPPAAAPLARTSPRPRSAPPHASPAPRRSGQGWSPQVPAHRAVERDEQAVERWRTEQWSRVRGRLSS